MIPILARIDSQLLQDVVHGDVLEDQHVLGHVLGQREEAALGVVPGVRVELLVVRVQRLDDARDAELEVALGAVQRADLISKKKQRNFISIYRQPISSHSQQMIISLIVFLPNLT